MSTSDLIALTALVISVAGGIANWLHTRKVFEVSTYPVVETTPEFTTRATLGTRSKNLSPSVSVMDVGVRVEIVNPLWLHRPWTKRRLFVNSTHSSGFSLKPLEEQHYQDIRRKFEDVLTEQCPRYLKKMDWEYIFLKPPRPLTVLVTTTYRPATQHAPKLSATSKTILVPETKESDRGTRFEEWTYSAK
jgi:hypothetical protein